MQKKLFWCKVNNYYLNQRINFFQKEKDWIIIASCEVTDRAKQKYIKEILTNINKWNHVYLTWCWSIQNWKLISTKTFFNRYPELQNFQDKITLLAESPPKQQNIIWYNKSEKIHKTTRKSIIIQNWCDNHCSFCLSIRKRWKHISRPAMEIIQEINEFQQSWWKEITLTWINLAARGCNNSTNPSTSKFTTLLKQIIEQTDIQRIRISSIWPEYINDDFFETIQNPRFMTHFHLSIQHFSDDVLKNMKRQYISKHLNRLLNKFQEIYKNHKHQISIWADLIVGFPGETEKDFQILLNSIKKHKITKTHIFPFSPHYKWETIPASFFEKQIPQEIKKQREKTLLTTAEQIREKFILSQKWKKFKVLLENEKNWIQKWRTENYILYQNTEIQNKNIIKEIIL